MRHPEVHGGNGFAAVSVGHLGFEPMLGVASADAKPIRRRKHTVEVGKSLSAASVSAMRVWAAGALAGGASTGAVNGARRKKRDGGVWRRHAESKSIGNMRGKPPVNIYSQG